MKFKQPITIFLLQNSSLAINLATQFVLTTLLPLNIFGSFAKVFVVRDILISFLSFSLGMSVIYNRTIDKEALIATSAYLSFIQVLIIFFVGSFINGLLLWLNYFTVREFIFMLLLIVTSLFTVFYTTFYSLFERDEKFIFNSVFNLSISIVTSIIIVAIAFFIKNETVLILREMIPALSLSILYVILIIKFYGIKSFNKNKVDKTILKEVMNYSFKMYFSRLSEAFFFRLDLLIVSRLFDSSIIGLYERARYFATLPWTTVISYINRIHFVKYINMQDLSLFKKTNYYAVPLNFLLFCLIFLAIYLLAQYEKSNKWQQILFILPFFVGYAVGSIVENYKTYFYAKGEVFYAMVILRVIPIFLFIISLIIINYLYRISIYNIALFSSLSYLASIVFLRFFPKKF